VERLGGIRSPGHRSTTSLTLSVWWLIELLFDSARSGIRDQTAARAAEAQKLEPTGLGVRAMTGIETNDLSIRDRYCLTS